MNTTGDAASRHDSKLAQLCDKVTALAPELSADAADYDRLGAFPRREIGLLADAGLLGGVMPSDFGGMGIGTEPSGAHAACTILRQLGRTSVALARLFEGHVNALKLVAAFGTDEQKRHISRQAHAGHLYAIWNTQAPPGLVLTPSNAGFLLTGSKIFASGVGHVDSAVVTAALPDGGIVALYLAFDPATVPFSHRNWDVQGVKGAATGAIDLTGLWLGEQQIIGQPGDYMCEPDFSAGAWRTLAVQTGAMEALYDQFRNALLRTTHASHPIQRARLAEVAVHCETARLWAEKAALLAEGDVVEPGNAIAYINLARAAVGQAAIRTIEIVQKGIGAKAFLTSNPVERIARDLSFYLRQPAPDQTLDEAAAFLVSSGGDVAKLWSD